MEGLETFLKTQGWSKQMQDLFFQLCRLRPSIQIILDKASEYNHQNKLMKTPILVALLLVIISSFSLGDLEAALRPVLSRETKNPLIKKTLLKNEVKETVGCSSYATSRASYYLSYCSSGSIDDKLQCIQNGLVADVGGYWETLAVSPTCSWSSWIYIYDGCIFGQAISGYNVYAWRSS